MGVGKWQLGVEAISSIMHEVVSQDQSRGMAIVSDSFRDSYGHRVIGMLPKSDASEYRFGWYGQKLTIKPVTRDTVGINVQNSLDGLSAIHLGLRGTDIKKKEIPYKRACRGHRVYNGYTILWGAWVRRGNVREVHRDNPAPPSLRDGGALRGACRTRPMSVCGGPMLTGWPMVRWGCI